MRKRPEQLTYSMMNSIVENVRTDQLKDIFINREMVIVHGSPAIFGASLKSLDTPFCISDYRIGMVIKGEVHGHINLVERRFRAGTLVFIGPGAVVQPMEFSSDLQIKGMALLSDFPLPFAGGQLPTAFNGHTSFFTLMPGADDHAIAEHLMDTIWQTACLHYDREVMGGLAMAAMHHWSRLYIEQADQQSMARSREQEIFDRFIRLVNKYSTREHRLAFYADKMCLTDRYLGTVIRQASGTTAKEWIDRSIITAAKIQLRHSRKSVAEIADDLHFPNPSFFCKYFRRLTGITPAQYQQS